MIKLAKMQGDQAEQMERIDVSGVNLQDLAIELLGLLEVACLMAPDGKVERLGNWVHKNAMVLELSCSRNTSLVFPGVLPQLNGHSFEHSLPVARFRLSKQPHCRVPRTLLAMQ